MDNFNSEMGVALVNFNDEAGIYCQGISDAVANTYAMGYTRLLQSRARGLQGDQPRIMPGLFEPNRNLIRKHLDRMFEKHFQASSDSKTIKTY